MICDQGKLQIEASKLLRKHLSPSVQQDLYHSWWLFSWFVIILIFLTFRAIVPLTITTKLPFIDIIPVLANPLESLDRDFRDNIIPLFQDIYLRNENKYLSYNSMSTIVVQPILRLDSHLSLSLTEAFFNFSSTTIVSNPLSFQTMLVEKYHQKSHSRILTYSEELMKLTTTPRGRFPNTILRLKQLCCIGYNASLLTLSMGCFSFVVLYCPKTTRRILLVYIHSIITILGSIFSTFTMIIVTILCIKYRSGTLMFDLIVLLISSAMNIYSTIISIGIITKLIFNSSNKVENTTPSSFSTESFNFNLLSNCQLDKQSTCSKNLGLSSFETQCLPKAKPSTNHFIFPRTNPKSSTYEPRHNTQHHFRNWTVPTMLQRIQVFSGPKTDDSSLFDSETKMFTSRFKEEI